MISVLLSRLVLLVFGTLYPAYASYKTVKTKNVRDYVKWMMYWIVFALYTLVEIFADIFIAFWFPFYYELKIIFVLWLMCPATRGSTYIFRKLIHPNLNKHEKVIDSYISSLWDHGYDIIRKIGAQGFDYVVEIVLELVRKGQITAANLLPKVPEVAQDNLVVNVSKKENIEEKSGDENVFDDEFDILMVESSELCADVPLTPRKLQDSDIEDLETESETELKSVRSRPLKLRTRNQKKVNSNVKERKRKTAK